MKRYLFSLASLALFLLSVPSSSVLAQEFDVTVSPQAFNYRTPMYPNVLHVDTVVVTSQRTVPVSVHMGTGPYGLATQDTDWCTFEPLNFVLQPGASQRVLVRVQLSDSSGRWYRQYFSVSTSTAESGPDPNLPFILVEATSMNLHPRHITLSSDSIDFGEVRLGEWAERTLTISSTDSAIVNPQRETSSGYEFAGRAGADEIDTLGQDPVTVTIRFRPLGSTPGERLDHFVIYGNTSPNYQLIPLRGYALAAAGVEARGDATASATPECFVEPDALRMILPRPGHVCIIDVLGRTVSSIDLTAGESVISTSAFAGLHFCTIECDSETIVRRFVR